MSPRTRNYEERLPLSTKITQRSWRYLSFYLVRFLPEHGFGWWRLFLVRVFGGQVGAGCRISPTSRIWLPKNLTLGNQVCLADDTDIYSVGSINIGSFVTISQRSFLCTATHDIDSIRRPLRVSQITIHDHAWVCADAFVGPGVTIGAGAVVGARAVVTKDVPAWTVVAGNPAREIRKRVVSDYQAEGSTPANAINVGDDDRQAERSRLATEN